MDFNGNFVSTKIKAMYLCHLTFSSVQSLDEARRLVESNANLPKVAVTWKQPQGWNPEVSKAAGVLLDVVTVVFRKNVLPAGSPE